MPSLKDLAESRAAVLNFDPRKLKIKPGLNGRDMSDPETLAHIEWLSQSIAEKGVRVPLEVFLDGDDVFVSSGHCRHAGAMLAISRGAELLTVPCIPEQRGTNNIDRLLNQNIDNSGKRLTPLEEGANIKRAIALGASIEMIAAKLGKSKTYVSQALEFQAAPAEVHALVKAGEVSATLAAKTIRKEGPSKGADTLREAVKDAKASGRKKATERNVPKSEQTVERRVASYADLQSCHKLLVVALEECQGCDLPQAVIAVIDSALASARALSL